MQDKKTLITIIVLLVIFLPLAVIGTVKHFKTPTNDNVIQDDNPNKDFIFNNKAYFYLENKLLGTYDCNNCSLASTIIDDEEYHTNSYREGTNTLSGVVDSNFAIFKDNDKINIYSIPGKMVLLKFDALKNYNVDHTNNILIAKQNNYWGVISLESVAKVIDYVYDYIALPAHFVDGKLDTSKFIVKKNLLWYIVNASDGKAAYTAVRSEIVDFNDSYYITYDNAGYHIFDYNNNEYLSGLLKSGVYAINSYIFIITGQNLLVYRDCSGGMIQNISIPSFTSISFMPSESGININIDGNLYQTLELQ